LLSNAGCGRGTSRLRVGTTRVFEFPSKYRLGGPLRAGEGV
jgi:hypothetical protein